MVYAHCSVCGVYVNCHRCHVKDKKYFSDDEQDNDIDTEGNIILMCEHHHLVNFDGKKDLGIYRRGEFDFVYVRWNHCCEGFCFVEPVGPDPGNNDTVFVNPFLVRMGHPDPIHIKLEYIHKKNQELKTDALRNLCMGLIPGAKLQPCSNLEPDRSP